MKITIKKDNEEITYKKITTTHTFNVNGKAVEVYVYDKQDPEMNDYDNDTDINEIQLKALTDEEHEVFGENLQEWLDLKVGETLQVDGWEE